ncbi:MAG: XdhC family protein [Neisseriaceae bacterium]|nr:XdhC family protein [Neisseriaceae bacterium]
MENLDLIVLRTLSQWRQQGQATLLVTVMRTWGSSPRPVGAIMALNAEGNVVGSVSGGCIEDDLIRRHSDPKHALWQQRQDTEVSRYGVSAAEAQRFGLPCGGTIELLLEYNSDADALTQLLTLLDAGHLVRRTVNRHNAHACLQIIGQPEPLSLDPDTVSSCFGPPYRMLLIGAGQLSQYVATMAQFSGFAVTVCDPRIEYTRSWALPNVTLTHAMPDDTVLAFKPDHRSCIIALTHDPKLDDLALIEALNSPAFYIGAIGSRKNNQARKQRLITHFNETEARLHRLHGPIGLYIGSKTPAHIAVSIMAEVIALTNGVKLPPHMDVAVAKNALEQVQAKPQLAEVRG